MLTMKFTCPSCGYEIVRLANTGGSAMFGRCQQCEADAPHKNDCNCGVCSQHLITFVDEESKLDQFVTRNSAPKEA
jgi:predicted RNA-binding Zn-ribbon protein involved in translation (DUF1610 family)